MKCVIKVLNLILAVILVGIMAVIWFGFNPTDLTASAYVEHQQAMIGMLNPPMPVVGAVTILLAFVSAYLRRSDRMRAALLLRGALLRNHHPVLQSADQRDGDDVERECSTK